MKCWKERSNEVLARTYSLYHQIMNTMIVKNGKKNFLYEKVGLHFGYRKQFIVDEGGGGVHCIPVYNDLDKPDTIPTENNGKLKHQRSNISTYSAGTVPEPTSTQLSYFGNGIGVHVERNGMKLGRSMGRAVLMMN